MRVLPIETVHDEFTADQQMILQRQLADKITNHASVEEIHALLVCGAQPDRAVTRGLTPLHYACFINYPAAAKLLLGKGAKVDAVDEIGCSALHLCAEHGHLIMIKLLLQYMEAVQQYEVPKDLAGSKYPIRENVDEPLRLAIKNGHYECARLLLEKGADPNAVYFDGPEITHISPLDTHFLKLLLEFGANPNVFDRKGLTPIMRACRMKDKGIEAIRILIEAGADVNALAEARQDHRTALHYALLAGNQQLVQFLIHNGATVNMPKGYQKPSVLDIAVLKDDASLLQTVLSAGADPNAVHTYIGSALHLACCSVLSNQYEIIRLLLEHGADMNLSHRFPEGASLKSPLVEYFRSREKVDERVLGLLLAYGGRVIMRSPLRDPRGQLRNVLKLAVKREQPEVLEAMLGLAEEFDRSAIERLPLPDALKGEILERARQPPSLQQACRLRLRSALSPLSPSSLATLPLPVTLKHYVLGAI